MDLDLILHSDSNRKKFTLFLKEKFQSKSADNLLTLFLLICCFKNNVTLNNDVNRMKQILEKTYRTCLLKHEAELETYLGLDLFKQLCQCLKNSFYDQAIFEQVKKRIKKIIENDFLPLYLKYSSNKHTQSKSPKSQPRALSSSSTLTNQTNLNKTASTLSLNLIQPPNPYHVKTKPIQNKKDFDQQSIRSDSKLNFKKLNIKKQEQQSFQVTNQIASSDPKQFFNIISSKLEKISLNSNVNVNENIENQLDKHLNHVSRISTKSVHKETKANMNGPKTTVAYYLPGESLAYISTFTGDCLTLAQFKELIAKKGNFRYFFKTKTDLLDEECIVFQEITDNKSIVPMFNDKVIAKIEYN